jgi:hypothetical protein
MRKILIGFFLVSASALYAHEGLIERAAKREFEGCYVLLNVQGYKQMYVNDKFKGNYANRIEDDKLESVLKAYIEKGLCREKRYTGNSQVVLRAESHGYAGCSVKLNIIGYNQVYKGEQFAGNYINRIEDDALEKTVLGLIYTGVCREPTYRGGYPLIDEVIAGQFIGCSITKDVEGYLQLYVNKQFSGNYVIGLNEANLEKRISNMITQGICRYID